MYVYYVTLDRPRFVPVRRANVAPVGWVTLPVKARQLLNCLETRATGRETEERIFVL